MKYFVYVLLSQKYLTRYVGSTENIENRLKEHNKGKCRYTSGRRPWKLIYREEFNSLVDARKRETFLKSGVGRAELDKMLKD